MLVQIMGIFIIQLSNANLTNSKTILNIIPNN